MITFKYLLSETSGPVQDLVDSLHYHVGKIRDLKVVAGKVSEEEFSALASQGGKNLKLVNERRSLVIDRIKNRPLRPIGPEENLKIVERRWGDALKAGSGAVVIVTSPGGSVSLKLENRILKAIDEVKADLPGCVIETVVNEKFATILLSTAYVPGSSLSTLNESEETPVIDSTEIKDTEA